MDQSPPQEASYRLDNQKNSKPFMKDTVYYHGLDKPSLEGSDDGTRQSEKKNCMWSLSSVFNSKFLILFMSLLVNF